jgi:hypothetical protein
MPIDIRVDSTEHVRYSLVTGVVTDADMIEAYERVVEDPDFDPTLNVLADTRGIERVEITAGNIRKLAERRAQNERLVRGQARVAVVVASDVVFGLARMYEAYRDQQGGAKPFLVCRTMEEARQWLALPGEPANAS